MLGLFARLSLQNNIVHSFLLLLLAFPPRFHSLSSFSLSLSSLLRIANPWCTRLPREQQGGSSTSRWKQRRRCCTWFTLLYSCSCTLLFAKGRFGKHGRKAHYESEDEETIPRSSSLVPATEILPFEKYPLSQLRFGNTEKFGWHGTVTFHRTISSFGEEIFH